MCETEKAPYLDIYAQVVKTGDSTSFETYFSPGKDRFTTIFQDITSRKKNEMELEIPMTKYKALFDSFPQGISVTDETGKIIEANAMSEKLLGITVQEHI